MIKTIKLKIVYPPGWCVWQRLKDTSLNHLPGQRAFKIYDEIDDYAELLPEMRNFIGRCKFGLDCTHTREPGCAIRAAVADGTITSRRYESFLGMKEYFGS